jgi:hypothetical protein
MSFRDCERGDEPVLAPVLTAIPMDDKLFAIRPL